MRRYHEAIDNRKSKKEHGLHYGENEINNRPNKVNKTLVKLIKTLLKPWDDIGEYSDPAQLVTAVVLS